MMKQFILTLAIYMAIVSSTENQNMSVNFRDIIVHNDGVGFMHNIGTVSEATTAKDGKVMVAGAKGDIYNYTLPHLTIQFKYE